MNSRNTKPAALMAAGKRTGKTVMHATQHWVKRGKVVAERHPGVVAGATIGYCVGRYIEWIPGMPKRLPRYMGAVAGASVGYVFVKAYREILAEQQPAQSGINNADRQALA